MDLDEYIFYQQKENPGYTKAQFAKEIGVSMAALRSIIQQKSLPTTRAALAIHRKTDGIVNGWDLIVEISEKLEGQNAKRKR